MSLKISNLNTNCKEILQKSKGRLNKQESKDNIFQNRVQNILNIFDSQNDDGQKSTNSRQLDEKVKNSSKMREYL